MKQQDNRERFKMLLLSTERRGIQNVLEELECSGFYDAPVITHKTLDYKGGLLQHSLNVYNAAEILAKAFSSCFSNKQFSIDSIIISSLLHDICKVDVTESNDMFYFPIGHGEKSVILLLKWGLELTKEEMLAIRWHMGAWDMSHRQSTQLDYKCACQNYSLVTLLHVADMLATYFYEK
jgi:hypothetical protein